MFNSNQVMIKTDNKELIDNLLQTKDNNINAGEFITKDFLNPDNFTSILVTVLNTIGIGLLTSYIWDSIKANPKSTTKIKTDSINANMNKSEIGQIINSIVIINQCTTNNNESKNPDNESISVKTFSE